MLTAVKRTHLFERNENSLYTTANIDFHFSCFQFIVNEMSRNNTKNFQRRLTAVEVAWAECGFIEANVSNKKDDDWQEKLMTTTEQLSSLTVLSVIVLLYCIVIAVSGINILTALLLNDRDIWDSKEICYVFVQ